ncbi:YitT family protein [Clostridiisalibacter paucivorans]|uniref:YitT family protein n=1 Tax=Clostridiisalibacter paucivorans TaxID=408753 RepID=UPI00047C02D8|nr:YitT family protein [Clostridiisalibacter paucivorans]
MREKIKEYIIITIGIIIVAFGLTYFLVPSKLAVGGVTGLALVVNSIFPNISIGAIMITVNILLFIVGFALIGPQFGAKTIYASFGLSGMVWIIDTFAPMKEPLTDDLLINLFYGILISAIGMAIVFFQNASTGGTDIVAKILNKYFHINIGKALLLSDFLITLMAGMAFGIKLGMYALLGVIMNGFLIDNVIEGFNIKKNVYIVSNYPKEIKKFIIEELDRGVTLYIAEGGYTEEPKYVIMAVMSKRQYILLRKYVKDIDNKAFILVSNVHEVLGEGFSVNE